MSEKYANGMYITTSKMQDIVAAEIFRALSAWLVGITMLTNLNQTSGVAVFTFSAPDFRDYQVTLDRQGLRAVEWLELPANEMLDNVDTEEQIL